MIGLNDAETILQLGAGRFLRAFVDRFVQHANDSGQQVGRIVAVQSTPGTRAELLNEQRNGFQVLVRGILAGTEFDQIETVNSISRALNADRHWDQVLQISRSEPLKYIVSNATEAGYVIAEQDQLATSPASTLPGKLTQLLWHRFQSQAAPLTILPCELIERNADKLLKLVEDQANRWNLPDDFLHWIRHSCVWLNNLVDCIVTPPSGNLSPAESAPLTVQAEPFALWAIERPSNVAARLFDDPAITWVDDLTPYYLRKVRILNGLHSAMVGQYLNSQFETVQQVLSDQDAARWVRGLLFEEILPTIAYRVTEAASFADQTWDRLRNPFLSHRLSDIALNHSAKVAVRLRPTFDEYVQLFGREPTRLAAIIKKSVVS